MKDEAAELIRMTAENRDKYSRLTADRYTESVGWVLVYNDILNFKKIMARAGNTDMPARDLANFLFNRFHLTVVPRGNRSKL